MQYYVTVSITLFVALSLPHFSPKAQDGCLAHETLEHGILNLPWIFIDLPSHIWSFHLIQAMEVFKESKALQY